MRIENLCRITPVAQLLAYLGSATAVAVGIGYFSPVSAKGIETSQTSGALSATPPEIIRLADQAPASIVVPTTSVPASAPASAPPAVATPSVPPSSAPLAPAPATITPTTPNPPAPNAPTDAELSAAESFFKQGFDKAQIGDYLGAIADSTKALQLNPTYPEAYALRSVSLSVFGDYQGAIADSTKAIELKPDYAQAYTYRGNAHAALKDKAKAALDYQKAAQLFQRQGNTQNYQAVTSLMQRLERLD